MMEILVTILIVSLGLLGIAALFARSHKIADESYARHEALAIARQLGERIAANRTEALKYTTSGYVGTTLSKITDNISDCIVDETCACLTGSCTSATIAAHDLAEFKRQVQGAAKQSNSAGISVLTAARGCVEFLGDATLATPTNPPRFRVTVAWQGREASVSQIAMTPANTCASGLYGSEQLRRLVAIEVQPI